MEMIWVRLERPEDRARLIEWLQNGDQNYFDPDCLTYRATTMLVAHKGEPIVAMPVQTALIMESLAVNPEAPEHEVAVGLREITSNLVLQAQANGYGEIYFFATNPKTAAFAQRHGEFEPMPWQAYRLKVNRLGEKRENIQEISDRPQNE